jgi:septum formation protein
VASGEAEDSDQGLPAEERVMAHARGKARDVAERVGIPDGGAVLGADTEVVLDGVALGKAADPAEAGEMLRALAGRTHVVMTGLVLITSEGERTALSSADVHMRPMDEAMVQWYLAQGEWQGRAGAYAIQGAGGALVEEITGDPSTIIGLPIGPLAELLKDAGLPPWCQTPPGVRHRP